MSSTGLALSSIEPLHRNGARTASSKPRGTSRRSATKRTWPQNREDLEVLFPEPGRLEFRSESRFSTWNNDRCRRFIELSLGIREVREVEIDTFNQTASVVYRYNGSSAEAVRRMARIYRGDLAPDSRPTLSVDLLRALPKSQPTLRPSATARSSARGNCAWSCPAGSGCATRSF